MALSIKNDEADQLARELAELTGESITDAVVISLRQRVERERRRPGMRKKLLDLANEVADYPILDNRAADEILGYDDVGLPH
ncbi:MAG TPA: type II toxin-antitoxin system VapB family antitoxin [Acidimicrobiia bacterium]|nr:type II toxin-antitoxin system VapB family antitoxin [Acidimicrobiia bacterium]